MRGRSRGPSTPSICGTGEEVAEAVVLPIGGDECAELPIAESTEAQEQAVVAKNIIEGVGEHPMEDQFDNVLVQLSNKSCQHRAQSVEPERTIPREPFPGRHMIQS